MHQKVCLRYLNDQKSLIDLKSLLVKLFVMNENTDSVKMKQELCIGLEKNHQTDDGVVKTEPVIDIPGRVKVEPETDANDAVVKIELKSEVDITNTVNVKTEESPCPEVGSFNVYDIKFEIDEGSPTVVKHKDCDMEDVASAQTSDAGKRKQVTGSTNDRKHRNPRLETTTRTGPHECNVCQRQFAQNSDLKRHYRIHTDVASAQTSDAGKRKQIETTLDRKQRKPQQESTRTVQGPHECNVCQRRFNRNGYLLEHLRTHTGEKPFECEVCQRRFSKKTNLLSHIRIHTGEKPFPCDICHMRFSKKTNLLTHIITHTGNKPFRCDVCQKRFSLKVNLISHSRTHTGEKPFKCEVCQKCFRYKARFLSHIRSYSCEQEIVIC